MAWTRPSFATLALAAFVVSCGGPVYQARPRRAVFGVGSGTRPIGIAPRLVVVDAVPPSPLYEEVSTAPFQDAFWVSGYWDWDGYEWTWIPGHWEVAPAGYTWIGPTYSNYGTYCEYTGGYWQREQRRDARGDEDYVPPDRVTSPPVRASAHTRVRPTPPTLKVREPDVTRPSYTAQPTVVPQETFEPQPSVTPRIQPNVTPPVGARPTAKPSREPSGWEDLDVAPARPSRVVPDNRPVARQPDVTPRPSFTPPPAQRPPVYSPPPAASAPRVSAPAFTPAPRVQSYTPAPRVQSYTPPPPPPASKPTSKPAQTFSPAPMKANKK